MHLKARSAFRMRSIIMKTQWLILEVRLRVFFYTTKQTQAIMVNIQQVMANSPLLMSYGDSIVKLSIKDSPGNLSRSLTRHDKKLFRFVSTLMKIILLTISKRFRFILSKSLKTLEIQEYCWKLKNTFLSLFWSPQITL